MRNFLLAVFVVLAPIKSFSMQASIESYVERFRERGDIFECSFQLQQKSIWLEELYSAITEIIGKNIRLNCSHVAFKYVTASQIEQLIKALTYNTQITSVLFQFSIIDIKAIESLSVMLQRNNTLVNISFTASYLKEDLIEKLQIIAREDKRVFVFAPNTEPFGACFL
jgi:hypothetical protein